MTYTPTPLEFIEDAIDGFESIVIEHEGCPILIVRGLDDMSCVEEEEEAQVAAQVVATAHRVVLTYNYHDQLVELLGRAAGYVHDGVLSRQIEKLLNKLSDGKE